MSTTDYTNQTTLTVTLLGGPAAFDRLADEWDALAGRSMTDTPFQSLAYQRGWWRHLQPAGATLHTLAARDGSGELRAIACFYLLDGVVRFNGCVEETDYLDLITADGDAAAAWTAVVDCLAGDGFPAWRALDLCNIPAASPTRRFLPAAVEAQGLIVDSHPQDVCPVIALPDSFETYLAGLGKKYRHEIRRKLRRAAGAELEVERIDSADERLDAAVDDFLALLQKSTPEKEDWLNDERRALFHETARAAAEAGTLQLLFAVVEGQRAAALFNFDYNGHIWVYNSGLDPEQFGHLSVGVVLTARAIEMAIEAGRQAFDFLRGNETYKYHFGAEDTEIFRYQARRPAVD